MVGFLSFFQKEEGEDFFREREREGTPLNKWPVHGWNDLFLRLSAFSLYSLTCKMSYIERYEIRFGMKATSSASSRSFCSFSGQLLFEIELSTHSISTVSTSFQVTFGHWRPLFSIFLSLTSFPIQLLVRLNFNCIRRHEYVSLSSVIVTTVLVVVNHVHISIHNRCHLSSKSVKCLSLAIFSHSLRISLSSSPFQKNLSVAISFAI